MVSDWNAHADASTLVAEAGSAPVIPTTIVPSTIVPSTVVPAAVVPAAVVAVVPAAMVASVAVAKASIIAAAVVRLRHFSVTTICHAAILVIHLDSNSLLAVSLLLELMILVYVLFLSIGLLKSTLASNFYPSFLHLLLLKLTPALSIDAYLHLHLKVVIRSWTVVVERSALVVS